ncbi:hypothetical protein F511_33058 [Dorcoceras hygrometricum]|uniref:Myb-like domain-containing protein n=1 Tax=Dorcoceras hygrometricum TaxID=472368 RepID=A0A2Z7CTU1_9LAMI|nr:hypothetical protein F511_33058 [Dorcoceras hygrometricum]
MLVDALDKCRGASLLTLRIEDSRMGDGLWKMGWSEINLCIKCDEGQNLLVCSENDCLLAVHENCMGCPARFDDAGNFYCPHCFHRQAVRESRRAWENAMSKKKALSIFEMMEEEKIAEAKDPNQSKGDEDTDMAAFHARKNVHGTDAPHQSVETDKGTLGSIHGEGTANFSPTRGANESRIAYKIDTTKRTENINGIMRDMEPIVAHAEADETSQQDRMLDRMENEERVDCHKLNKIIGNNEKDAFREDPAQVQEPSVPSRRQLDNINMYEEHKINIVEEESVQEEVSQSSRGTSGDELALTAQAGSKGRSKLNDSSDGDFETVSESGKRPKPSNKNKNVRKSQRKNPPRRLSSALRNNKEFDEQVGTSRRSNQSLTLSVKPATDLFVGGKRKRLMWRKDEEEMLKEGVQKFATTAKQNLPWRKILEFGRHVFDETRTPVDLKDKWRNLLAR